MKTDGEIATDPRHVTAASCRLIDLFYDAQFKFFFTAHELNWTCVNSRNGMRVVRGSISCDPIQPNPSADRPNPTRPNTADNEAYSLVVTIFIHRTISYF